MAYIGNSISDDRNGGSGNGWSVIENPIIQLRFSNTITDGDPGSGYFRLNNATQSSSTFIYADDVEYGGGDFAPIALLLTQGSIIRMQCPTNRAKYAIFEISGAVTDGTGYGKIPITFIEAGLEFEDGDVVGITIISRDKKEPIILSLSDLTSDLEVGTAEQKTMHFAGKLTEMFIDVLEAPTGSTIIVDVKKNGTSIFTTKMTIDASEISSSTAAAPYVINGTSNEFVADDEIEWVIDQVGATTTGAGLSFSAIIIKS